MKTLKQITVVVFLLGLIFSCTNETIEENDLHQVNYDELNLKMNEHINSYASYFESRETVLETLKRFSNNAKKSSQEPIMTIYLDLTSEKVEYTEEDLADIYTAAQKTFLLAYFNEVANTKGNDLLDIIAKHKLSLENTSFTAEEYEHILFLLESHEKTINLIDEKLSIDLSFSKNISIQGKDCFLNCIAGEGRNIGRGIAGGAITGGVTGAYIGATGGTVVLPGIGTATGAVGGGAFGAAGGAISGGIIAAFFSVADCLVQCENNNTDHAECSMDEAGIEVCESTTV